MNENGRANEGELTGANPDVLGALRKRLNVAFGLLLVAIVTAFAGLMRGWAPLVVAFPLVPIVAVAAMIAAGRVRLEGDARGLEAAGLAQLAGRWITAAGAVMVVLGAILVLEMLAVARTCSKAAVSWSHLRGIGQAIKLYHADYAEYPPHLHVLVGEGMCTPKQLMSPQDVVHESDVMALGYSSYLYQPGRGAWQADPGLVLAYERLPFGMHGTMEYGRPLRVQGVLFADGTVRPLSMDEIAEAMLRDRRKRIELGWPVGEGVAGPGGDSRVKLRDAGGQVVR